MGWFQDHAVLFALLCAGAAIAYGLGLTLWLLQRPAGTERMQEIARAVQEGAAAYLRRQYSTIAVVAIVPFLLLGFYHKLGWGTAVGFLIGATLSAAAGFIGMNGAVRSNVRYTKAADVGADLVGKIEAGIPEDDPRNPAVIADNVGDNVGDCAGMAADLFETYAVTAVAVMLLGVLTFQNSREVAIFPLVIGGVSILASIIGTFAVRSAAGNVERALYQGLIVSGLLAAAAFYPISHWMMGNVDIKGNVPSLLKGAAGASGTDFWLCGLIGIGVTAGLFVITDYYTSTRFRPVRTTARASQTGHATNIIQGLAQGFQSTAAPAILLVIGILIANEVAGIYGIGVAVMGPPAPIGLIVGGMMVYLFAALAIEAVGRAGGGVVEEVRRQFKEKPGIMDRTEKPDYARAVAIVTASAQREMVIPALIPIVVTTVVGLLSTEALGGLLIGVIVVGFFAAISMTAGGGAWDNAKKLIEDGEYGGKGPEAP